MGYPAEKFGLHSLRAGGATAVANADVPDRLFKDIRDGNLKMPKMVMWMIQWKDALS